MEINGVVYKTSMWTFVFIVAFCSDLVRSETLRKFQFHEYCDTVIDDDAGDLEFDSDELPSYLPDNKCRVSIIPRQDSQIKFYFEAFELSIYCEDTNLTVTHGDFYDETTVLGLPRFMCGRNSTLLQTDQTFATSKDKLTITYSYTDYGKRFYGKFRIKFLQFHTGSCDDDNEYKCSNDDCVDKAYQCSDDIRACPKDDQDCETDESVKSFVDLILGNVGWIVLLAVVIYVLRIFYPKFKYQIREYLRRICTQQEQQNVPTDSDDHQSLHIEIAICDTTSHLTSPDQTSQHSNIDSHRHSLISSDCASPEDLSSASFEDAHSLPDQPIPNVPPPSYDEVMSNDIR